MLELLPIALFGPTLSWADYITSGCGEDTICVVELEFLQGPMLFRVRRTYTPRQRGKTTLDFEFFHDYWQPLTRESQAETQALICSELGISQSTFAHSVFAAQGARHFADPSLTPRERKEILSDALGLGLWDHACSLVRNDLRQLEREIEVLAHDIARIEQLDHDLRDHLDALDQQESEYADAEATLERLDAQLGREADELTRMREANLQRILISERHQNAVRQLQDLTERAEKAQKAQERLDELQARLAALSGSEDELARLTSLQELQGEYVRLREAWSEKGRLIDDLEARRHHMAEKMLCERCGQELRGSAVQQAGKSIAAELRSAHDAHEVLAAAMEDVVTRGKAIAVVAPPQLAVRIAQLRDELVEVSAAQRVIAHLEQTAETAPNDDQLAAARAAVEELEAGLDALGPIDNAVQQAEASLFRLRAAYEQTDHVAREKHANVIRLTERVDSTRAQLEQLREVEKTLQAAAQQRDRLARVALAYSANGIPAMIMETSAIPHIEQTASFVLEQLGMPLSVELRTQTETKSGTTKETLLVLVRDTNGVARRYETFSGGERTRIEYGLRIGLAQLIAQRSGSAIKLLALDEPSYLDGSGLVRLAEVLRGLTEFESVLLISHDDRLTDLADQCATVMRVGNRSRLEMT